jgi:hypothetical protein
LNTDVPTAIGDNTRLNARRCQPDEAAHEAAHAFADVVDSADNA